MATHAGDRDKQAAQAAPAAGLAHDPSFIDMLPAPELPAPPAEITPETAAAYAEAASCFLRANAVFSFRLVHLHALIAAGQIGTA